MSPADSGAPSDAELAAADRLGVQLVRFARALNRVRHRSAADDARHLDKLAYAMLFRLVEHGPQRTGRLAELLYAEISLVSRQTRALVQLGLIERRADPDDGRASVLAATEDGVRVFEQARQRRSEWLAGLVAEWSATEVGQLTVLLDRLNDGIEADPRDTEPGRAERG